MGSREPHPIEKKYNKIQGRLNEIRLLRLVKDEAESGWFQSPPAAIASIERIARTLSQIARASFLPIDVACKMEELRKRFEAFIWFTFRSDIHYSREDNIVTALPAYWEKYADRSTEPVEQVIYRVEGFPNYKLCHQVYTEARVGRIDMQWLMHILDGADPKWLPDPIDYFWWEN